MPAEEWVELANGCLCCSVKSDFVAALEGLMLKRDKFDYILIETTGQAHTRSMSHYSDMATRSSVMQNTGSKSHFARHAAVWIRMPYLACSTLLWYIETDKLP